MRFPTLKWRRNVLCDRSDPCAACPALDLEMADLQRRFASPDPAARAQAAVGMADLAEKTLPGRRDEYPWYPRAAARLAAALCLEGEPAVRGEILAAVAGMAAFARDRDPSLLHRLIADLAHANRSALDAFLDALARYRARAGEVTDERLGELARVAPLGESAALCRVLLGDLIGDERCRQAALAYATARRNVLCEATPDGALLPAIALRAAALRSARDGLAGALRVLSTPVNPPRSPGEFWKRDEALSLAGCFLADADLVEARLPGADLSRCCLRGARLYLTDLRWARLWGGDLRDAGLTGACLQNADLGGARLEGAHLAGAALGGARLYNVALADADGGHPADLGDANWWEARFTDPFSDRDDDDLRAWLSARFPPRHVPDPPTEPGAKRQAVRAWLDAHSPA